MTTTIHAVYENGVFRPTEKVDLPERTSVEMDVRVWDDDVAAESIPISEGLAKVYEILGRRHRSGHTDTAERHNEHQP
jgi:predicted DNA-binding antitoxin AbrB/MazE fold protein